jgi:hypothetical protein
VEVVALEVAAFRALVKDEVPEDLCAAWDELFAAVVAAPMPSRRDVSRRIA